MDYVNVKALHLKAALKKEGKTMRHFNERLGKNRSFLSNVLTGSEKITRDELQVVADGLGTTVEYLMGETNEPRLPEEIEAEQGIKASIEKMFERSDTNLLFDRMAEKEKVFVEPVETRKVMFDLAGVTGVEADHQKMAQLLCMIAKKPSAKKDMDDILTYLEFIAKRGE